MRSILILCFCLLFFSSEITAGAYSILIPEPYESAQIMYSLEMFPGQHAMVVWQTYDNESISKTLFEPIGENEKYYIYVVKVVE